MRSSPDSRTNGVARSHVSGFSLVSVLRKPAVSLFFPAPLDGRIRKITGPSPGANVGEADAEEDGEEGPERPENVDPELRDDGEGPVIVDDMSMLPPEVKGPVEACAGNSELGIDVGERESEGMSEWIRL